MSGLEEAFLLYLRAFAPDMVQPLREHQFARPRRWKFDFAWPDRRLAVEIEGGIWGRGRHTRGKGYAADCTKYNEAVARGWRVLRYTSEHLKDPETVIHQVQRVWRDADASHP